MIPLAAAAAALVWAYLVAERGGFWRSKRRTYAEKQA